MQPWKEELAKEVKELQAEVDSEAVPNSEGLAPQTAMIGGEWGVLCVGLCARWPPWPGPARLELSGTEHRTAAPPHPTAEQMNLAWAQHEIISDYLTACLAWLEGQGVTPIEKFVAELKASGVLDLGRCCCSAH